MATVFLAVDLKHQRSVAIKVLHPELATSLGVERFLREITTAAGLNHPHILALYDSGQAEDLLYYVMPYIEGETLRGRLQREGQLSIADTIRITSEIAEALGYAHSRGVVHRDIKPENIMFSAGRALVADFGIARALTAATLEPLTAAGAIVGTPAYMSPEKATGSGQLDGRSDIYSRACVVYEMLTGSVPFTGLTAQAVMARHSVDIAPPIRSVRPTVTDALERAVLTALAKAPADRFATAAQFVAALTAREEATTEGEGGESIAVLPFANLSGDPEFEYFSEGIAEEIINALTQLPGLHVAARTSSFAFRGPAIDLTEVGAKLKVATVLEGSVRKAGNRLRIGAQLVKVGDGYHLWSERYDREMTDVFAIQDEISRAIATRLQVTLGGEGGRLVRPATGNLDAYHLYLKGRYYLAQRGLGLKKALECFDQALALDPQYALAYAGLADACTVLAQYGLAPPNVLRPRARAAVQKALHLAPDLAEVYCASGALGFICDWDWPRAATPGPSRRSPCATARSGSCPRWMRSATSSSPGHGGSMCSRPHSPSSRRASGAWMWRSSSWTGRATSTTASSSTRSDIPFSACSRTIHGWSASTGAWGFPKFRATAPTAPDRSRPRSGIPETGTRAGRPRSPDRRTARRERSPACAPRAVSRRLPSGRSRAPAARVASTHRRSGRCRRAWH